MQVPLHLTFHNMGPSEALEARVREKVDHLDHLYSERLTSCRVAIEAPHKRGHKGHHYQVRIFLGVPGGELAVTRDPDVSHAHEDALVAIRDAFNAAERMLEDYIRKHRGDVKTHEIEEPRLQGTISSLLADQSGGFVDTPEGEVYFHRNSVTGGSFDDLRPGQPVELVAQYGESEKGLQASTIRPLRPMKYAASR